MIFEIVFEKIRILNFFMLFWLFIFEISKEEKSKTINARTKTRTDLESALNSAQRCIYRVFVLALIVFDFYSFEGSKTHFTGEPNVYI